MTNTQETICDELVIMPNADEVRFNLPAARTPNGTRSTSNTCWSEGTSNGNLVKKAFFFVLDVEGRIMPVKQSASFDITDITDRVPYEKLPLSANDIGLTFITDGAPLFESSSYGISSTSCPGK